MVVTSGARCMTWKPDRYVPGIWWRLSAQTDNFMTKRASGLATYRNNRLLRRYRWPELNPAISREKTKTATLKKQNGDGFGTSLTYDFGGSDFAISGASIPTLIAPTSRTAKPWHRRAEAWATGLKYDANNIYLATFYSETRKMTPPWRLSPIRRRTLKRSLNTSLTLVCVHRWLCLIERKDIEGNW